MPLYNHQGLITDPWQRAAVQASQGTTGTVVLVALGELAEKGEALFNNGHIVGVEVETDTELDVLAPYVERLGLISVRFDTFKDGRGFTLGRLIRERLGFTGELRAAGDILLDQVPFLLRVGFSTFELAESTPEAQVDEALNRYSVWFQTAADSRTPVQRLRRSTTSVAAE